MTNAERKYNIGQYVTWKHSRSSHSGDGIIKEAMFWENLSDNFDKGWYYLISGTWVFEGYILENRS